MRRAPIILLFALFGFLYVSDSFTSDFATPKIYYIQPTAEKLVVLTFDDGPKPAILLGKNGQIGLIKLLGSHSGKFIPAHFFVIGGEIQTRQKLVKLLSQEGFFVENHTYGHENLLKLRAKNGYYAVFKTILKTDSVIFEATGRYPKYLRPPYWATDADLKKFIANADFKAGHHHKVVSLENPDINTLDYDDYAKKRSPVALVERVKKIIISRENHGEYKHVLVFHELPITVEALKTIIPYLIDRGYKFGTLDDFFNKEKHHANFSEEMINVSYSESTFQFDKIRAAYLSVDHLYNPRKIEYIFSLFDGTELNAVVIDFKVDKPQINRHVMDLIGRLHKKNIYVIGRLVMFQDSYLAKTRPDLAIKNKNAELCFSGRKIWQRYWVDMASDEVLNYNMEIAKRGIDMGFDEINFDYIRFPSDLGNCRPAGDHPKGGNLKNNILYPVWDGHDRYQTMRWVFSNVRRQLKDYAVKNNAGIVLSIDVFGEVFASGSEAGIGQKLSDIAEFFDVISPMAYPSHYRCGEFGLKDPNVNPYIVYNKTLEQGLKLLREIGFKGEIRPWIQDFSIANIYGCGPAVYYGPEEIRAQIKASGDLGLSGFMFWNAGNNYTKKALMR